MEFYVVVKKRRTARDWQDKDVSYDIIKRIIDAGLAGPSNNHLREWEFIVLHSPEEKENALHYAKAWTEEHGLTAPDRLFTPGTVQHRMYKYAMPRQYSMLKNTPYVILGYFGVPARSICFSFLYFRCILPGLEVRRCSCP